MEFWEDFDTTFAFKRNIAYDTKLIDQIEANRKALEGTLFVDRLLTALSIDSPAKVYPPNSNATLRELYKQIIASPAQDHHKQSLIYYILRDLVDSNTYLRFAERSYLPEKYRLFVDGLWHLDRLHFREALRCLTDPSLIPTFPDEILYTLCTLAKDDESLATAYYLTTTPPLATEKTMNAYFSLLCRTSVTEAFFFSRKQPEHVCRQLQEKLIVSVLSSKPGPARSDRAAELLGLPFDEAEEEAFEKCLLQGPAKHYQGSKDTVMMRRIAMGQLDNLTNGLESLEGRRLEGLNWDDFRRNLYPDTTARLTHAE